MHGCIFVCVCVCVCVLLVAYVCEHMYVCLSMGVIVCVRVCALIMNSDFLFVL
jgi:hypothetical protein